VKTLLLVLVFLIIDCSCLSVEINQNRVGNFEAPSSNRVVQPSGLDPVDQTEELQASVKKTSGDFGLQNLKEKALANDDVEIRFWVEKMSCILYCLVLRRESQTWASSKLTAQLQENGQYHKLSNGKYFLTTKISSEQNLTEKIDAMLSKQRIMVPLPFSLDKTDSGPTIDGGRIVLEVKDKEGYSMVYYKLDSKYPDAERLQNTLTAIESEIGLTDEGCSYEKTKSEQP